MLKSFGMGCAQKSVWDKERQEFANIRIVGGHRSFSENYEISVTIGIWKVSRALRSVSKPVSGRAEDPFVFCTNVL